MGVEDTPENRAKFESSLPLGQALQSNTSLGYVANAAIYICSDEAAFVSGTNLPVDGGATVYAPGGELLNLYHWTQLIVQKLGSSRACCGHSPIPVAG